MVLWGNDTFICIIFYISIPVDDVYEQINLCLERYIGPKTKEGILETVWWKCSKGHEWKAQIKG